MTQASTGAMHWSKPSESRFCERSAKAIGLLEALVARQLAWASRGRRWHTRWISWGSLARQSDVIRVYWGVLHPGEGNHEIAARRQIGSVRRRHRASGDW